MTYLLLIPPVILCRTGKCAPQNCPNILGNLLQTWASFFEQSSIFLSAILYFSPNLGWLAWLVTYHRWDIWALGVLSGSDLDWIWQHLPVQNISKLIFVNTIALHARWLWSKYATLNGCMSQTDCFKISCCLLSWRTTFYTRLSTNMFCAFCSCVAWQTFCCYVDWASRTSGNASAKSRSYSLWLIFVGLRQRGSLPLKAKNGKRNSRYLVAVSVGFLMELCPPGCRRIGVCKKLGRTSTYDAKR